MQEYVSPGTIKKSYEVSFTSLVNWAKDGKIRCVTTPGGCRKYHYNDVIKLLGHSEAEVQGVGKTVLYARVSSQKQAKEGDLDRQIQNLEKLFEKQHPNDKYVVKKDVGSGINWKRKGFRYLLDEAHSGTLGTIVVSDRDRLCRLAFDLVEYIFKQKGVKILVLNKNDYFESTDEAPQLW
jgi:predicted site-specific integrase-resolvase